MKTWGKTIGFIVLLIVANLMVQLFDGQIDLTPDNRFTLSDTAKNLLSKSEGPVVVTVLLEGNVPPSFRAFREYIDFYLGALRRYDRDVEIIYQDPNDGPPEEVAGFKRFLAERGIVGISRQVKNREEVSSSSLYPYVSVHDENSLFFIDLLEGKSPTETEEEAIVRSQLLFEKKLLQGIQKIKVDAEPSIHVIGPKSQLIAEGYNRDTRLAGKKYVNSDAKSVISNIDSIDAIVVVTDANISRDEFVAIDIAAQAGIPIIWAIDKFTISVDSIGRNGQFLASPNELNVEDYLFNLGVKLRPELIKDLRSSMIPQVTGEAGGQAKTVMVPYPYHLLATSGDETPVISKTSTPVHMEFVAPIIYSEESNRIDYKSLLTTGEYVAYKETPVMLSFDELRMEATPQDYSFPKSDIVAELRFLPNSYFGKRLSEEEQELARGLLNRVGKTQDTVSHILISDAGFLTPVLGRNGKFYPAGYNIWDRQMYDANVSLIDQLLEYLINGDEILQLADRTLETGILDKVKWEENKTNYSLLILGLPFVLLFAIWITYRTIRKRRYASYL